MANGDNEASGAGEATRANLERMLQQVASELSAAAGALREEAELLWIRVAAPDESSGTS